MCYYSNLCSYCTSQLLHEFFSIVVPLMLRRGSVCCGALWTLCLYVPTSQWVQAGVTVSDAGKMEEDALIDRIC